MNPEVKQKWVAALRSGKYEQGQGHLINNTKDEDDDDKNPRFCCLGVLCDIYGKEHGLKWEPIKGFNEFRIGGLNSHINGYIPMEVSEWSGLDPMGELPDGKHLASLNDSGTKFDKIADIIEEQL